MLYFYYGEECPHCHHMMPLIDKLIEEGKEIQKKETWHSEENAQHFEKADNGKCGGVPFFLNTDSGQSICGATTEERVRAWANGETLSQ
ncbi:hypothetical protein HYV70_03175 [Candidatus Uhrbacteria bacterium]|nr:hypothetical protein [Candidatus Uhrbacteria bacterium]